MILDKTVEIRMNSIFKKYYKEKGYDITKKYITVKIEDLQKGSNTKINCKCDICGKEVFIAYKLYLRSYNLGNMFCCDRKCSKVKASKTNIEKYGYDNPAKSEEIKEKTKKSNLEKWGDHPSNINSVKDKLKITRNNNLLNKYRNNIDSEEVGNVYKLLSFDGNNFNIKHNEHNFKISRSLLYDRQFSNSEICTLCNPKNDITERSFNEVVLYNYIKKLIDCDIIENDKSVLNPKHLDIYIPSYNLAIEFNGLYWHSERYKDKNYHLNKTLECKEKDIQLLHIWEDDWVLKKNICKSIIKNRLNKIDNIIYARKCDIKEVKSNITREFLDENHIQGFSKSTYKLGLYYKGELVSLMTFGYRKTNAKKEFELIRFCNKLNTNVIGSSSKLFKHFINNYNIEEDYIISYADISLFNGKMYEQLGFKEIYITKPNYFWVVNNKREHRWKYNKQKLIKEGFSKDKTEVEIMQERGYYRIFGCGQKRYEFKL